MFLTGLSTNKEQRGLLASNVVNANNEQCVQFYYYHEASPVGSLNIYAKLTSQNISSLGFPLWSEPFVNNGYNGWQLAQLSLGHYITNTAYQIIFEEYVQSDKPGNKFNIYIDDVFIRDQSCLPAGDCDFENGFCNFFIFSLNFQTKIFFIIFINRVFKGSWSMIQSISNTNWVVDTGNQNDIYRPLTDHRYLISN